MPRDRRPSEFGGVPGLVQPLPHEPTPAEEAALMRAQDPMDTETHDGYDTGFITEPPQVTGNV